MKNVEFTGNLEWLDTLAYIEKANCVYGQISKSFTSAITETFEYLSCGGLLSLACQMEQQNL